MISNVPDKWIENFVLAVKFTLVPAGLALVIWYAVHR